MHIISINSVGPLVVKTGHLPLNVEVEDNKSYVIQVDEKAAIDLAKKLNAQPFIKPSSRNQTEPK